MTSYQIHSLVNSLIISKNHIGKPIFSILRIIEDLGKKGIKILRGKVPNTNSK